MLEHDLGISDKALGAEERLARLYALDHGLAAAVGAFLRQVESYNQLLEEELEDRPAAAEFLRRSGAAVAKAVTWLEAYEKKATCEPEGEALDVRLLLEGAVRRCQRVLQHDQAIHSSLVDDEILVDGSLFQLQDLFMGIILMSGRESGLQPRGLYVHAEACQLDQTFLRLMKSRCTAGQYFVVTVGHGVEEAFDREKQVPFLDCLLSNESLAAEGALAMLQMHGLVRAHRGDLFVRRQREGCHVAIALPVCGKIKDMQAPHNIEDEHLYGDETILLVDDEDTIWDVIIDMLQELRYTVILAANGCEAVEIYRENPGKIDLVLLDMVMPEMDGHQAFFELKKLDPGVRVLLSSGYVSEEDARDVLDAGAAGFLQKPYRMVDLARRVRAIFDSPGH